MVTDTETKSREEIKTNPVMDDIETRQIRVYGIVQGVGFRPTVSRHAAASGIHGTVCNRGPYVEIFTQGTEEQLDLFEKLLSEKPPKRAAILKLDSKPIKTTCIYPDFEIIESAKTTGEIFISPDIATCDECREELYDPKNRRFKHPFINCTCCGPRLTILDALPYDRERTSMKEFPMCPDCAGEYYSPATRRYDAQPVCCNACGPEVYLLPDGKAHAPSLSNEELKTGGVIYGLEAIRIARETIVRGGIVAIKGIGGYHLCCDATNEEAVQLLRTRKNRPHKPFAIMMRNMETVLRECRLDAGHASLQKELLTGHQKPILLLPRSAESCLAPGVAPGNPKVGVMLPYAPVQMLLFDLPGDDLQMPDCLVMTSGNVSGAPICRDDLDAAAEIGHLCDQILSHNRMIRIRADDTVLDLYDGKPYMIRRSRGFAPLPFMSSIETRGCVLGIGGELKNTFCIGVNGLLYPSPYVGDLADLRTVRALRETSERFQTLLEVEPKLIVCDLHPKYNSTQLAMEQNLPVLQIQHHYAHVLSCMAEQDYLEPVIGVSFDGTGYGTDGTIWGGEILLADLHDFTRIGHVKPFLQLGGDASSREGWRIAASMIYDAAKQHGENCREAAREIITKLNLCSEQELKFLFLMSDRKINSVLSTSAGRLFDAVSAILGICRLSTFEGEASTSLQFAAEKYLENQLDLSSAEEKTGRHVLTPYETAAEELPGFWPEGQELLEADGTMRTDLLTELLVSARLAGEEPEKLAFFFHKLLADMVAESCRRARTLSGRNAVVLTGGCYQNLLLLALTERELIKNGFQVLRHSMIPPNDGGIAAGQALYGLANYGKTDPDL